MVARPCDSRTVDIGFNRAFHLWAGGVCKEPWHDGGLLVSDWGGMRKQIPLPPRKKGALGTGPAGIMVVGGAGVKGTRRLEREGIERRSHRRGHPLTL